MSIRVDTASLIPGAVVVGNRGLGVLGSLIPSTGDGGRASCLYNDLALPADASVEVRGYIEQMPVGLTSFLADEDGSFEAEGPDGAYNFTYRLYADGVDKGTATAGFTIGALKTVALAGAASSQSAASGTGAVAITPAARPPVALIGAGCSQPAASAVGSVAVIHATPPEQPDMITLAQARAYLATQGVDVTDDMLEDALATVATAAPAMQAAGYDGPTMRRIQRMAVALVAAPGGPRRVQSQGAPSGASRSFKYADGDFSALRRSLRALDTAGTVAQVIGPDPVGVALFFVV